MGLLFSAREIAEIGIEIERNGAKFYSKIADKATGKIKEVFQYLAEEELRHEKDFTALSAELPDEDITGGEFDEEYVDYFHTLTDNNIFTKDIDIEELTDEIEDPIEALEFALEFEKDSILLFMEMKTFMSDKSHKDIVDKLIKQERGHIIKIDNLIADQFEE